MTSEKLDRLLDGHAAECVEELLECVAKDGGDPWFNVIRNRLEKFRKEYDSAVVIETLPKIACDICDNVPDDNCGAWDEDDRYWCVACMDKWEKEHKQCWATGQPKPF